MNKEKDTKFDFWNDHSLEFLEMAMKRDYQEHVKSCDGYGKKSRDCGDTLEFFVMVKNRCIESISYDLKGCIFSHACANTLIHFVEGKSILDARKITKNDITSFLKTLPSKEDHCAAHAISAFFLALNDYEKKLKFGLKSAH